MTNIPSRPRRRYLWDTQHQICTAALAARRSRQYFQYLINIVPPFVKEMRCFMAALLKIIDMFGRTGVYLKSSFN